MFLGYSVEDGVYKPVRRFFRKHDDNLSNRPEKQISERFLGSNGVWVMLPCRRCLPCQINYVKNWSTRAYLEGLCHSDSVFLTLTYDEEHLPNPPVLVRKDYQDFLKRLRKRLDKHIRVFGCGEYGSVNGRPHFHFILYGVSLVDLNPVQAFRPKGNLVYSCKLISDIWPYGFHSVGSVSIQTLKYVARYTLKKQSPEGFDVDSDFPRPYLITPRRPGLGVPFLQKFSSDLTKGFVVVDSKKVSIPLFLRQRLQKDNYLDYLKVESKLLEYRQKQPDLYDKEVFDQFCVDIAREDEYYTEKYSSYDRC